MGSSSHHGGPDGLRSLEQLQLFQILIVPDRFPQENADVPVTEQVISRCMINVVGYAAGESNMLISPASVDMGGVLITPLEKDFAKITATDIKNILDEVCIAPATATLIINRIKS